MNNKRQWLRLTLLTLLAVMTFTLITLAQDDDPVKLDEFLSAQVEGLGSLVLSYPEGWVTASDSFGGDLSVYLASAAAALEEDDPAIIPSGDVSVGVLLLNEDTLPGLENADTLNAVSDVLLEALTTQNDMEMTLGREGVGEFSGKTYYTYSGDFVDNENGSDGAVSLIIMDIDGVYFAIIGIQPPGELGSYAAELDAIARSMDFIIDRPIELTESVITGDGSMSAQYPEGWVATGDGGSILMANSLEALDFSPMAMESGFLQGTISVFTPDILLVHGLEIGETAADVLDGMIELTNFSNPASIDLTDTQPFTIDGREGVIATGTSTTEGEDGTQEAGIIYAVLELESDFVFMVFYTAPGDGADFVDILQAIAASVTYLASDV